jgi:hypothetical protein
LRGGRRWRQLRQGAAAIVTVLGRPAKAAQLFGGSAAVTALYVLALSASLEAFRSPVPVVEVTAVYLGSAAIAAAAPTPGICPVGELRSEMHRFGASRSRERPSRPRPSLDLAVDSVGQAWVPVGAAALRGCVEQEPERVRLDRAAWILAGVGHLTGDLVTPEMADDAVST